MTRNGGDFNAPGSRAAHATLKALRRWFDYGDNVTGDCLMTSSATRILLLAAAVAAAPFAIQPAAAQDGVSVTIRKGPTYLNTRTTPSPGSATRAAKDTSAVYQPVFAQRNSIAFSRYPLPSTFDIPGY
jgi:hypothetical protein